MSYRYVLPTVFPWVAWVKPDDVESICALLIRNSQPTDTEGTTAPDGSSFAVIAGVTNRGKRLVWLSDVSHKRVVFSGRWPEIYWEKTQSGR